MSDKNNECLAIDYGTTNSLAIHLSGNKLSAPLILDPTAPDPSILRSIMYTPTSESWFFGQNAISVYEETNSIGRLLRSIKKFLPRKSFNSTMIHERSMTLPEIVAVFLREIKDRASTQMDRVPESVVLGRPALFSTDEQEDALAENRLREAAKLAGFKYVEFCPEPIAAAYEFRKHLTEPKIVLIADFGGGTSDFTIVELKPKTLHLSKKDILSINGISLAGDAFDGQIMEKGLAKEFGTGLSYKIPLGQNQLKLPKYIVKKLNQAADINFLAQRDIQNLLRHAQMWSISQEDERKMERLFTLIEDRLGFKLYQYIEKSKKELSQQEQSLFQFHYPTINLEKWINQSDFCQWTEEVKQEIIHQLDETLKRANLTPSQIDLVCCTGGTAKIKHLQKELAKRFGKEKLQEHQHFHSVIKGLGEFAKDRTS